MSAEIRRLVGVYNADGGVRGGLAYVLDKLRGGGECALCDVTHRGLRDNPDWKDVPCELAVPFDLIYRNDRDPDLAALTGDSTPAVAAETADGYVLLMGPEEFIGVDGDAEEFVRVLRERVATHALNWPASA